MIFGPNRSRRHKLELDSLFEKFSNERVSEQTNETNETNEKIRLFFAFFRKILLNDYTIPRLISHGGVGLGSLPGKVQDLVS